MKSITSHITPRVLLAEIRLQRQKHKGVFFLMEGGTDSRRFEKFLDRAIVFTVVCHGKTNVLGTVDLVQQQGQTDVLGFVDADFDRLIGVSTEMEDIIHSSTHDFDVDVCCTAVVDRYLNEMALEDRLQAEGGSAIVLTKIMEALRPLSALRFANSKHQLGYRLDEVDLERFFNGNVIDRDAMIDHVSQGSFSGQHYRTSLRAHVEHYSAVNFALEQFTNGHDLIAAIGIALRNRLANRNRPQTWRGEVEKHLRLTFDVADFGKCGLKDRLLAWQAAEARPSVLRSET